MKSLLSWSWQGSEGTQIANTEKLYSTIPEMDKRKEARHVGQGEQLWELTWGAVSVHTWVEREGAVPPSIAKGSHGREGSPRALRRNGLVTSQGQSDGRAWNWGDTVGGAVMDSGWSYHTTFGLFESERELDFICNRKPLGVFKWRSDKEAQHQKG